MRIFVFATKAGALMSVPIKAVATRRAFTLVELLVVIGIIAVLIAMLLPALTRARTMAVQTQCMSQQRQLMFAVMEYANDHFDYAPAPAYLADTTTNHYAEWTSRPMLGQYIGNKAETIEDPNTTNIIFCPAYEPGDSRTDLGIGYNVRNFGQISRDTDPAFPQVKFSTIRHSSQVFVFTDVLNGPAWEKFFYNEPWPADSLGDGGTGVIAYRHGGNAVAAFADGHVQTFQGKHSDPLSVTQNVGLQEAYINHEVFFAARAN
jgi:prepilin-type N-terminal cleavage/methylation domain-containing protein/prepilin-type processing-associated H-X9-DG protein